MQKPLKYIFKGVVILIGLVILTAGAFFAMFYISTKNMTPAETARINDSVFCIRDQFVNAYIFKGRSGYLMVDAGMDESQVRKELARLKIPTDQVTTLLLTHTDTDHTGAVGVFPNARIFMHRDEEQMINGKNGKYFFLRLKWKYKPYELIDSNDTLMLDGLKIKVYHTPGHTPGSCCFMVGDDYLLTGDNLAYIDGKFSHFNSFFNMDTKLQEKTILSLPTIDSIPFILTAHYGVVSH